MWKSEKLIFLFLAFVVILPRLYKIDIPLADWHSWRQADTVSVTRFLIEDNFDVLHPRYHDISKIQTGYENPNGYRFVEFPIFNILNAVIYLTSPWSLEVSARLVSVLAAVIISWSLYLLGKKMAGFWTGFFAALVFAILPFSVYFTRVALPDPLSTAFGISGLYFFWQYLDTNVRKRYFYLYFSAFLISLGLLTKPFAAFLIVPGLIFFVTKYGLTESLINGVLVFLTLSFLPSLVFGGYFDERFIIYALPFLIALIAGYVYLSGKKVTKFKHEYIAFLVVLAPFLLWRAWMQKKELLVGVPFSEWLFNGDGIRFRPSFWYWMFGERIGKLILGYWGVLLVGAGFLSKFKKKILIYLSLGCFLYISVFATANVRHDYYQIFIVPALSLALGHGIHAIYSQKYLNKIYSTFVISFSLGLAVFLSFYHVREFYKINDYKMLSAAARLKEISKPGDLVIAPYNGNSVFVYHTGRRGWPMVTTNIQQMIEWGADYYVSTTKSDKDTTNFRQKFPLVEETKDYIILRLANTP